MSHLSISSRGLLMWDKIFAYWYSKLVTLPGEPHRHIVKIILVAHHILATRLLTHLYTVGILIFTSPVGEVGYFSWLETISIRTPLLDVAYTWWLLSILHSLIITLISLGFPRNILPYLSIRGSRRVFLIRLSILQLYKGCSPIIQRYAQTLIYSESSGVITLPSLSALVWFLRRRSFERPHPGR